MTTEGEQTDPELAELGMTIPGNYTFLSLMGRGASGAVYRALDRNLNREVAIKTIYSKFTDAQVLLRFEQEAKILSTLKHPNIVEVLVYGITQDNCPYMVMTFVDGHSLSDQIAADGRIPFEKTVKLFIDICDGMVHVHNRGILHRDLKPDNIMLVNPDAESPTPVIVDFGVGKLERSSEEGALTKKGSIIGTPIYMSPEQLLGKSVDARCDIYSTGCMIFECLTGTKPFEGKSELDIVRRKQQGSIQSMDKIPEDELPSSLKEIVRKCLAPNAVDRYQSMQELRGALQLLAPNDERTITLHIDNTSLKESAPKVPRGAYIALLSLALVSLVAFLIVQGISIMASRDVSPIDRPMREAICKEHVTDLALPLFEQPLAIEKGILKHQGTTDDDLRKFAKYRRFQAMKIDGSNASGKGFEALTNLPIRSIEVNNSPLTQEGVRALSKIKELSYLKFRGNQILTRYDLKDLAKKPNLSTLVIESCGLTNDSLTTLPEFPKLRSLDLANNRNLTDDCLPTIKRKFPNLAAIGLARTSITTGAIVQYLKSTPNVTQLNLRKDPGVTDTTLEMLSTLKLQTLYLPNCPQVTDRGLMVLSRLKSLKELTVYGCKQITAGGVKAFNKALPTCKVVGPGLDYAGSYEELFR